jgi:NADH dehydrogenase FAD-containing subunit
MWRQLKTTGPRPATGFLSSLPASLTSTGHVKPTLQLADHPRIFAAGDIIDWNEQKQAAKVDAHAGVVTANVLSIIGGKDATTQYKGSSELIVVTNGKVRPCVLAVLIPYLKNDFDNRTEA